MTEAHTPTPDWPHASWDDVVAAVCDASNNAEGRTSAYYLEHHFQKAGLVVLYHVDMPEHPSRLLKEREELRAALEGVLADIRDYERINNLLPNPGREDCWQSVTRARATLLTLKSKD